MKKFETRINTGFFAVYLLYIMLLPKYKLERGTRMDGQEKKKHISAQEYKLQQLEQQTVEVENRRRAARDDVMQLHQIDIQTTQHINEGYGELLDIAAQKQDALDELGAIKHAGTHARTRTQKARERAQEQEARNRQAQIDTKRIQREYKAQKDNLQEVKSKYKHLQKQVEQVQQYLTIAEQRELEELYKQDECEL